jgi:hypothetical protein
MEYVPKGKRFVKEGGSEGSEQIIIILKGNALVRIPQDNVRISMKVGEYFAALSDMKSNIMIDYNTDKKDVLKMKEEIKAKEHQEMKEIMIW